MNYLQNVRAEMKHVSWPSRNKTIIYTAVVIVISFGIAAYLGILDFGFSQVIQRII